jgi:hypothetical protein
MNDELDIVMKNTMPPSRLFMDRYYSQIDAAMKSGNANHLGKLMNEVLGQNRILSKLELSHPGEQIFFGSDAADSDRNKVFNMFEILPQSFKKTLKECPTIDEKWVIANKPFNWLMAMLIKWYSDNNHPARDTAIMYLTVSFYSSIQFKYFRRFYQANVMAFAMNNLSDKFMLKQSGTMLNVLSSIALKSHEKYSYLLKTATDKDLFMYFVSFWSRINGIIRGLKNQYEEAKASGAYLNQSKTTYDDDEQVERKTEGGSIQIIADRALESLLGETVPQNLIELASKMGDMPKQNLILAINEMRISSMDELRVIFHLIIELYFEEKGTDIRTRAFLAFAYTIYVRSNTKDGRVESIKEKLDKILRACSSQYLKTNRMATRSAFRKTLYLFLVLFLQQNR